jgi:hypothetical protein
VPCLLELGDLGVDLSFVLLQALFAQLREPTRMPVVPPSRTPSGDPSDGFAKRKLEKPRQDFKVQGQ